MSCVQFDIISSPMHLVCQLNEEILIDSREGFFFRQKIQINVKQVQSSRTYLEKICGESINLQDI